MISIVPYFAGFITILFSLALYLSIQEGRKIRRKAGEKVNRD